MSVLNKSSKLGYVPQIGGVVLTVDYTPAGYGSGVVGVHSSGVVPGKVVDATQQSACDPLVVAPGSTNAPDNFLSVGPSAAPVTQTGHTDAGVNGAMNAAQAPSAGKSLSPAHE